VGQAGVGEGEIAEGSEVVDDAGDDYGGCERGTAEGAGHVNPGSGAEAGGGNAGPGGGGEGDGVGEHDHDDGEKDHARIVALRILNLVGDGGGVVAPHVVAHGDAAGGGEPASAGVGEGGVGVGGEKS